MRPKPDDTYQLEQTVFWYRWPTYDILRGDLQRAGIQRVDALGRALHFHSFRKTWQTLGVRYGINQRVAQEVLGHSDANLTAKVYTDVPALSLHTEIAKLPWIDANPKTPTFAPTQSLTAVAAAAMGPEAPSNTHTGSLKPAYNLESAQRDAQNSGNSRPTSTLADLCAKFVEDVNLAEAEGLSHVLSSLVTSLHCDKMAARRVRLHELFASKFPSLGEILSIPL